MLNRVLCLALVGGATAGKPVIEVSLTSASGSHSAVSGAISQADAKVEADAKAAMGAIDAAGSQILAEASASLTSAISRALGGRASFANPVEPTLLVKVVPSSSDDGAGVSAVAQVEGKRGSFSALVSQAKAEMGELAKVIVSTFESEIRSHKHSSFLQRGRELNVRVVKDSGFSSIGSMISSLESRRDASESAVRAKILDAEMALVQGLNRVGAAALASRR